MTDRLEELIWAELDGELTEAEGRELAELKKSGETADEEAEIRHLAAHLQETEPVEPPAELRGQILDAIGKRGTKPSADVHVFEIPGSSGTPGWAKWGYLAAAILVGIVAYQLAFDPASGAPDDNSELVGTVMSAPLESAPDTGAVLGTGLDFVRLTPRSRSLDVQLTPGEGSFLFVFRAPGLEIERIDFQDGATGTDAASSEQITVRVLGPGRVEMAIRFAAPDRPFTFLVLANDQTRFEGEFFLHQPGL